MSLLQRGCRDQAIAMVNQSTPTESWENPVAAILRAYCREPDASTARRDLDAVLMEALALVRQVEPSTAVFRTRVALTALDLAEPYGHPNQTLLRNAIVRQASTDAYAAREAISSVALRASITAANERHLADVVESSGLGRGFMPAELLDDLTATVRTAEDQLRLLLDASDARAHTSNGGE